MLPLPPPVPVEQDRLTAGPMLAPVPINCTVCGLPCALVITVIMPVRVPAAVGEKLTFIVHFAVAAKLAPQLLVSRKSPLGTMLSKVTRAPPSLVSVIGWAWLVVPTNCWLKVRLDVEKDRLGNTPVPVRLTVWGVLLSEAVIESVPVRVPVAAGVKVTWMEQLLLAARLLPQLLVCAKSPLAEMLESAIAEVPAFDNVTV
jgi:hypothetical protein